MPAYELKSITGGGKASRFYANGVRVSQTEFARLETTARMFGRADTFTTRTETYEDGGLRVTQTPCVAW